MAGGYDDASGEYTLAISLVSSPEAGPYQTLPLPGRYAHANTTVASSLGKTAGVYSTGFDKMYSNTIRRISATFWMHSAAFACLFAGTSALHDDQKAQCLPSLHGLHCWKEIMEAGADVQLLMQRFQNWQMLHQLLK